MAWMERDYVKHMCFRWKVKCRLEHLGALGIMGETAPLTWLHRVFLAVRVLGTNMAHGTTKTNTTSLILQSFFSHTILDILVKFEFLQCVLWSFEPCEKQTKVAKLTNEFTHVTRLSCSCLLRHFNFEREKSAPKLPPLYLVLGIATANATCAEDEDSSFSGNKENSSEPPTDRHISSSHSTSLRVTCTVKFGLTFLSNWSDNLQPDTTKVHIRKSN